MLVLSQEDGSSNPESLILMVLASYWGALALIGFERGVITLNLHSGGVEWVLAREKQQQQTPRG